MTLDDDGVSGGSASWSRRAALIGGALAVLFAGASIWLDIVAARTGEPLAVAAGWEGAIPGLALAVPGALLLARVPRNTIAIVLLAGGIFWAQDGLAASWVNYVTLVDPSAPLGTAAFWSYQRLGAALLLAVPLVLVLFPTGRLLGGWWRAVSVVSLGLICLLPLTLVLIPTDVITEIQDDPVSPQLRAVAYPAWSLELPMTVWRAVVAVAFPSAFLGGVLALVVAFARFRKSGLEARLQMRWLLWAGTLAIVAVLLSGQVDDQLASAFLVAAVSAVGWAVLRAVTKHRLYEVDELLTGTLLFAVLGVVVIGTDLLIIGLAGTLFDERDAALVSVAVVGLAYLAVRDRLWTLARRLVLGDRTDPFAVTSELARRLDESSDRGDQMAAVATAIASAFGSPYTRVELELEDGGRSVTEHGTPRETSVVIPIRGPGPAPDGAAVEIGRIAMAPGRQPRLSARDQLLLADLVRRAAAAVRAAQAVEELQGIRQRLVTTREDERRRLRRELHDGLGPLLAGIGLHLEAAKNFVADHPDRAERSVDRAADIASDAVLEVRRIVQDLRPTSLDDVGLARSLVDLGERFSSGALRVDVRVAELPADLAAAVEVAIFRIASEAVTNVARHSGATRATLSVGPDATGRGLVVELTDDGRGIPSDAVAGVGLRSQRERAAELGGSWSVASGDGDSGGRGTRVRAVIPLWDTRDQLPEGARP